jgi:hypothetical protein
VLLVSDVLSMRRRQRCGGGRDHFVGFGLACGFGLIWCGGGNQRWWRLPKVAAVAELWLGCVLAWVFDAGAARCSDDRFRSEGFGAAVAERSCGGGDGFGYDG